MRISDWSSDVCSSDLRVERVVMGTLLVASLIAIVTTFGIVASLLLESIRFFQSVSPFEFLFGTNWSPQTAIRADQVGSSGAFGAVPLFWGTIFIEIGRASRRERVCQSG